MAGKKYLISEKDREAIQRLKSKKHKPDDSPNEEPAWTYIGVVTEEISKREDNKPGKGMVKACELEPDEETLITHEFEFVAYSLDSCDVIPVDTFVICHREPYRGPYFVDYVFECPPSSSSSSSSSDSSSSSEEPCAGVTGAWAVAFGCPWREGNTFKQAQMAFYYECGILVEVEQIADCELELCCESSESSESSECPIPDAPVVTLFPAEPPDDMVIGLSWDAVADADSYNIYLSIDGDEFIFVDFAFITGFTLEDVECDKEYAFYVTSVNECGESEESNIVSQLVECESSSSSECPIPDAPFLLSIQMIGEDIKLEWSEVSAANTYKIYRSVDGGSYTWIDSVGVKEFTDINVDCGLYSYYVTASNECGESEPSNILDILPCGSSSSETSDSSSCTCEGIPVCFCPCECWNEEGLMNIQIDIPCLEFDGDVPNTYNPISGAWEGNFIAGETTIVFTIVANCDGWTLTFDALCFSVPYQAVITDEFCNPAGFSFSLEGLDEVIAGCEGCGAPMRALSELNSEEYPDLPPRKCGGGSVTATGTTLRPIDGTTGTNGLIDKSSPDGSDLPPNGWGW